jgi:hypothetical protein
MASFVVLLLVPVLLSKGKVSPALFFGYFGVVFALVVRWLARHPAIPVMTCLLFAIGDDLVTVGWAMPFAVRRAGISQLAADALLLAVFALLLVRLWKDSRIVKGAEEKPVLK